VFRRPGCGGSSSTGASVVTSCPEMAADRAAGATLLYLPPYSPDLNPIELAFSKLKQWLRSAGHRTMNALWSDMQRMLEQITPHDAAGFYRHCGYTLQEK